jgi:hypothetical protein
LGEGVQQQKGDDNEVNELKDKSIKMIQPKQ